MSKVKKKQKPGRVSQQPQEKSRKLIRKEKRLNKKNRRVEYQANHAQLRKGGNIMPSTSAPKVSEFPKGGGSSGNSSKSDKNVSKTTLSQEAFTVAQKELKQKEKLQSEMAKQRRKQLLAANKDEDREIKRLEKLLKLDKRKKKNIPKSFYSDNLGSVLEVCDRDYLKRLAETEKTIQDSGSDFEEDFAAATGRQVESKKKKKKTKKNDSSQDKEFSEEDSDNPDFTDEAISDEDFFVKSQASKTTSGKVLKSKTTGSNAEEFSGLSDLSDESDFGLGADDGTGSEEEDESDLSGEEDLDDDEDGEFSENESDDIVQETKIQNRKRVHFSDEATESASSKKVKTDEKRGSKGKGKAKSKKESQSEDDEAEFDDDEGDVFDDDEGDGFDGGDEGNKPKGGVKRNPDGTWEDIYGRLRSSAGDVVEEKPAKYVPPHLRGETSDSKKKELERLRRQMKGLMNRLAENNMAGIASQLDEMYMANSRHDMNDTLTSLTLEALVAPVLTPDRLVMEHCLLIALLHANVGSEVGAHFLQTVVQRFDQNLGKNTNVEDKTLDNIVHIVSHLYNFKIFSASLIFSILDKVAETLNEKRIDLLLLMLRTVGSTLRKSDPVALKNLVLRLQTKAAGTPALQESSRVKFMLEVLLAIKNNNMMKIPNYNPEIIEHAKKLLRSLIRRGKYVTELNISLEDLLKADERGRWWIVGSAWTGHLPGERNSNEKDTRPKESEQKSTGEYNVELLELARKQRMNTDTRRNIFCILLTAEDYLDAFEKLLHLNLTNQQDQEIIHVLLHCALQEKTFNPYYAHLAQKFCDFDRKYQMKLQYAVWDKLKELTALKNFQISNLARLLAHLFLEKGLPISVLKVVSFAEIDKTSVRLIRQILLGVLMVEDRNESEAVFLRVAPSPKLRLFREGLRLFIRHFMLQPKSTKFLSQEEMAMLEERADMAEKALSAAESELQF